MFWRIVFRIVLISKIISVIVKETVISSLREGWNLRLAFLVESNISDCTGLSLRRAGQRPRPETSPLNLDLPAPITFLLCSPPSADCDDRYGDYHGHVELL